MCEPEPRPQFPPAPVPPDSSEVLNVATPPLKDAARGGAPAHPAHPAHPARLSDELAALLSHAAQKPITLQQIVNVLAERAHTIVVILLSLPFMFPIPTLGLSALAGAVVMLVGLSVMLGLRPWLPGALLRREIAYPTLERMVNAALKALARVEWILKPRLLPLTWPGFRNAIGAALLVSGFILSLPLPVPFTNGIPALAVVLLGAGLLERDGIFILAGFAMTLVSCIYLYLVWDLAWQGIAAGLRWLGLY